MFNIGPEEIILILVVALVFLGPNRLPEVARQIGKGLREFRSLSARAQKELMDNVNMHDLTKDLTKTPAPDDLEPLEFEASPPSNGKSKKTKGAKRPADEAGVDGAVDADTSNGAALGAGEETVGPSIGGLDGTHDAPALDDLTPAGPAPAEADADPIERSV